MREIPLTRGKVALVDDDDWPLVAEIKWHALVKKSVCYAQAKPARSGPSILMHRVILGAKRGQIVDHINGDGLDNRRRNLRLTTPSGNATNNRVRRAEEMAMDAEFGLPPEAYEPPDEPHRDQPTRALDLAFGATRRGGRGTKFGGRVRSGSE